MESNSTTQREAQVERSDTSAHPCSKGRISHMYSQGKIGWIFLWLLGVPIPILFGLFLLRGCT